MSGTYKKMGEYAREEIKRRGLKIAPIARKLGITRQSMDWRFSKEEWSMSEVVALQEAIEDPTFFDRYFKESDMPRPYSVVKDDQLLTSQVKEDSSPVPLEINKGYRISVEVDPDNFNPQEWDRMSEALKEMMDKLKE